MARLVPEHRLEVELGPQLEPAAGKTDKILAVAALAPAGQRFHIATSPS